MRFGLRVEGSVCPIRLRAEGLVCRRRFTGLRVSCALSTRYSSSPHKPIKGRWMEVSRAEDLCPNVRSSQGPWLQSS